jgi:hypothetical protein
LSATGLELLQDATLLAQSVFGRPIRNGSMTFTVVSAPNVAILSGKTTGIKMLCNTVS